MIDSAQLRREADFVLKNLRGPDDVRAFAAARRFSRLPALAGLSPQEVRRRAAGVQRSHALDLIAIEHGFGSWGDISRAAGSTIEAAGGLQQPGSVRRGRRRLPRPPTPEELARRVAERVRYFAEPLPPQCGGGQRLDVQRVREEALAAILDALRGDRAEGDERGKVV